MADLFACFGKFFSCNCLIKCHKFVLFFTKRFAFCISSVGNILKKSLEIINWYFKLFESEFCEKVNKKCLDCLKFSNVLPICSIVLETKLNKLGKILYNFLRSLTFLPKTFWITLGYNKKNRYASNPNEKQRENSKKIHSEKFPENIIENDSNEFNETKHDSNHGPLPYLNITIN